MTLVLVLVAAVAAVVTAYVVLRGLFDPARDLLGSTRFELRAVMLLAAVAVITTPWAFDVSGATRVCHATGLACGSGIALVLARR